MATKKKLANAAIVELAAEMAKPSIAASALSALGSKALLQHRELVFVDSFHGHECSRCKCRFPETALPKDAPKFGHVAKVQRERELRSTRVHRRL
jgi:hypothetical protein